MKNTKSKLLNIARKMPPLYHSFSDKDFDIKKSEVVKWLIDQPDILNYLWNNAKQGCTYNTKTKKWQGVDYEN